MNPAPGGIALTKKLLNLSLLQKGSMILDVGCGDGDACRFLSSEGYRAIGLDILRCPSEKLNSERIQGQSNAIPILEETVDAVLMECVLSILPTDDGSLTEIIRVLKTGGILMFSDLYMRSLMRNQRKIESIPKAIIRKSVSQTNYLILWRNGSFSPLLGRSVYGSAEFTT
jgi:ubiquinone/menaquinone biosynthesis C-methylase UbiE